MIIVTVNNNERGGKGPLESSEKDHEAPHGKGRDSRLKHVFLALMPLQVSNLQLGEPQRSIQPQSTLNTPPP